jgi:hypothetical protein
MKRAMMTSVVAGLLGTLGFAPVVSAEATFYGSVRSGIYMLDPQDADSDTTWDIGSVDAGDLGQGDRLWSRIGVRASSELDGGITAGLHIEKRLDNFRTRHQNVWIGGNFGRLTLGQQGSAYYSATTWDGSNLFGDWTRGGQIASRVSGLKYSSNLGGPFNFAAMVLDGATGNGGSGDGVNATQITGTMAAGPVTISAGYVNVDDNMDFFGGKASGAYGGLDWVAGFEVGDDDDGDDRDRYGFTAGYTVGSGRAYVFYEDLQTDSNVDEISYLLVGYSHSVGPGVTVIAEYQAPSEDSAPNRAALALKVDF